MAPDLTAHFAHVPLPIRTARLLLRPLEAGDLDAYGAYQADPEIHRWLERRLRPHRGATLRPRMQKEAAETAARRRLVLGIVDAVEGRLVGRACAFWPDSSDPPRGFRVGLSVGVVAAARRQGIARETMESLMAAVRRSTEPLQLRIWIPQANAVARAFAARFPHFVHYVTSSDGQALTDCLEWIIPREPRGSARRRAS